MRYVYRRDEEHCRYPHDVERIVSIFEKKGHEVSFRDAMAAWQDFSDDMCAGWMGMDHYCDQYVFDTVRCRLSEVEE